MTARGSGLSTVKKDGDTTLDCGSGRGLYLHGDQGAHSDSRRSWPASLEGAEGEGVCVHLLLALVILAIDHASFSRRSTVSTPKSDTLEHFGRSIRCLSIHYVLFVFADVIPFLFRLMWPPSIS